MNERIALEPISYTGLNSRQKETYNFHRAAARLVEYGYNSILLTDDWLGADFIAYHNDGERFYRVQLKGRMAIDAKYVGKGLYIAFFHQDRLFVFPHDVMADKIDAAGNVSSSESWSIHRSYSWPNPPRWLLDLLAEFEIPRVTEA